jgi:PAS domain-containing protein
MKPEPHRAEAAAQRQGAEGNDRGPRSSPDHEAISEQLEFTNNLIQNCAVAIFVIDQDHRVVNWNRACEALTGLQASEVIGTADQWKPFYDYQRPCLSDLIVDQAIGNLPEYYGTFGKSALLPKGYHAEGWYPGLGGDDRYVIFDAAPVFNRKGELVAAIETLQDITASKVAEEERRQLIYDLREALSEIKTLTGLLPICSACKKIRNPEGYWKQIEAYIMEHSDAEFSHGLCPECTEKLYPGRNQRLAAAKQLEEKRAGSRQRPPRVVPPATPGAKPRPKKGT